MLIKWSRQYWSLMLFFCQFDHSSSWVVQLYWDFNRYVILIEHKEGLIWQNYRAANNSRSSNIGPSNLLVSDEIPPVFGHYSMFGEFFVVNHFNIVRMISNSWNNIELGNKLNEISWPVHSHKMSSVLPNKVQPFFGDVRTKWCLRRSIKEAAWSSSQCVGLAIRQSRVLVPLWPLAGFVPCGPSSNPRSRLLIANWLSPASWGF